MQVTPLSPLLAVSQLQGNDADPSREGHMLKSVRQSETVIGFSAVYLINRTRTPAEIAENAGQHVDTYA